MSEQNSDFEQNFIAQVKGETPIAADPQTAPLPEKKPINKKLIIIIALAVLLIITLVTLLLIKPKPATEPNIDIIGYWGCSNTAEIYFNADNTYIWYQDSEADVVDTGEFTQNGTTLTVIAQSSANNKTVFDLRLDGSTLTLVNQSNNATYTCTGAQNE